MTILELEKKIKCDKETFEIFFREGNNILSGIFKEMTVFVDPFSSLVLKNDNVTLTICIENKDLERELINLKKSKSRL